MSLQTNWQYCNKCQGMYYAGKSSSVCPAGGAHSDTESASYVLANSGGGLVGWNWCSQCQGLFYSNFGESFGVCPAHSKSGSDSYVLPTAGQGSNSGPTGWKYCGKCQGLFFCASDPRVPSGLDNGVCPAGGAHNDSSSETYVIPTSGQGQAGWRLCSRCQGLFYSGNGLGGCPAGGSHAVSANDSYVLPTSGPGQPGWSWCNQCQGLFYSGVNLGVCPTPHSHAAADGSLSYQVPTFNFGGGQAGWTWCNKCRGLFYTALNGVCPSRNEDLTNQPLSHDGTGNLSLFPIMGMASSQNYYLSANCTSLQGVSVTILIKNSLVLSADSPGGVYSFQLNCNSLGGSANAWQQFVIWVYTNGTIQASCQSFDRNNNNVFSGPPPTTFGPNLPNGLVAGDELTISFIYSTTTPQLVIGANFSVIHNGTASNLFVFYPSITDAPAEAVVEILNASFTQAFPGASASAPIVALQLVVGGNQGSQAQLYSGVCAVTYNAFSALTPSPQLPTCAVPGFGTAESSNVVYSPLTAAGNPLTQSFTIAIP